MASTRPAGSLSIGLVAVGEPQASMPSSAAIRSTRSMCGRSETKTASRSPCAAQDAADRADRLERRPAPVLDEDRLGRHAVGDRVRAGRGRLGRPVAVRLAAGHDEARRDARRGRASTAWSSRAGEDRRRAAVVLGGAQHHDRVGRPLLVALALRPDPVRRVAGDDGDAEAAGEDDRVRSRAIDRCIGGWPSVGRRRRASAPVALLVLRARAAPARVVAPDPGARSA